MIVKSEIRSLSKMKKKIILSIFEAKVDSQLVADPLV